jgi:hypothetical protein
LKQKIAKADIIFSSGMGTFHHRLEDAMRRGALVLIGVMLLLPALAAAAVCPDVVSLGSMSTSIGRVGLKAHGVAIDGKGNSYVTDGYNDALLIFDYSGTLTRKVGIKGAAGVAIDDQGRAYIGSYACKHGSCSGGVTVYDSSMAPLFSLGSGAGEFKTPNSIVVDSSYVYVADTHANIVKVYARDTGEFLAYIGSGALYGPNGIAIGSNGNLYILEFSLITDGSYTNVMGAGGQFYTPDGGYLGKFGSWGGLGTGLGAIYRPGGIAADGTGRVYASDALWGTITVFDESGAAVCAFKMADSTPYPAGVTIGADGRMLVAATGQVFVYGLDSYVHLAVSPSSLAFEAQRCGALPPAQAVTVANEGPGSLEWTAEASDAWIGLSQVSGEINGVGSVNVGVSVDASGLDAGTHSGTVTFRAQGAEATVAVSVTVVDPPALSVSPGSFSFFVKGTDIPPSESLEIMLDGDTSGLLSWTAESDSAWIGVTPGSGPSNVLSMAGVGVSAAALQNMAAGEYTGTITVDAGCSAIAGSPATVTVALTYVKGGTIIVKTNLDGATFTISGPEGYAGSGTEFSVEGVPEGAYTVTFDKVAGFKGPSAVTLDVVDGTETVFTGEYIDLRERNSIIATMGGGQWFTPDDVRVFDGSGGLTGSFTVATSATAPKKGGSSSKEGMATATGDIDGDGADDIVVAHDKGVITGYTSAGAYIAGVNFRAFEAESDVDLAVADLDGDGVAEIIVSAGTKSGTEAEVRVFRLSGGAVVDTGLNFIAYTNKNGANVAAGDLDGDGVAEIITGEGGNGKASMTVRLFKVDASKGLGAWSAADAGGIDAGTSFYGADVTAADLDADGVDEVIVATVASNSEKATSVAAYNAAGIKVLAFTAASEAGKGASLAADDMDMDGMAEIVLGEGTQAQTGSTIRVFGPDGASKGEFKAFNDMDIYGVRVSLGIIGEEE